MKRLKKEFVAQNAREYVQYWAYIYHYTARNLSKGGNVLAKLRLDYIDFFKMVALDALPNKIKKVSDRSLEDALCEFIELGLEKELKEALTSYKCSKENLNPLLTWIKAVTGKTDEKDMAVIAHWMWLVKRKALNMPVKHQIMPVLFGPQGGGKTVAIEKLIYPLETFRLAISMHQLSDERTYDGLANNFIVVFDELQGVERTDMNALKKQITTNYNTYRKLHTHIVVSVPMRCSFIGATNRPISESFNDSTGMRRFWELVTLDKLDWEAIGSIDYKELWIGIDENNNEGYLKGDRLLEVHQEQHKHVNKEQIDEFLEDVYLRPESSESTVEVCLEDLFPSYIHWTAKMGINKKMTKDYLKKRLIKRKFEYREERVNNKRITYFKVNSANGLKEDRH